MKLLEGEKPYYVKLSKILKIHKETLKIEANRLIQIDVLNLQTTLGSSYLYIS